MAINKGDVIANFPLLRPFNLCIYFQVSFFDFHKFSKRVTVHLGEAGVIIQHKGALTYAFVLFQSLDRLNVGLLKDGESIGGETVETDVISLFEAMVSIL